MKHRSRSVLLLVLAAVTALLLSACGSGSGGGTGGSGDSADDGAASTGQVLWRSGTTQQTILDSFQTTPWNTEDAEEPRAVPSPDVPGRAAVAFTVPGGGKRSELQPKFGMFDEGDRYYFGLSLFLPEEFPVDTDDWQVVAQWKNTGDGSPPLSVKVQRGRFVLDGGAGEGEAWQQDLGPAVAGERTDLVLGVRFASDPSESRVDVWRNGEQVLRGFQPPVGTLYPDQSSYMKVGLYRNSDISEEGTVYYDDVVIADGRAAAADLSTTP